MHETARLISGTELIAALEKLGFERVRQKGSHVVLKRTLAPHFGCVVPLHKESSIHHVFMSLGLFLSQLPTPIFQLRVVYPFFPS